MRATFRYTSIIALMAPPGQIENGAVATITTARPTTPASSGENRRIGCPAETRLTPSAIRATTAVISDRCSGARIGKASCGRKNSSTVKRHAPQ